MLKIKIALLTLLAPAALSITGCSSAKKTPPPPVTSSGQPKVVTPTATPIQIDKTTVARPVTQIGDNRQPRFSADGTHLLFVSSGRPSHKQAQVYELDLVRMTERRLTFHDGDDEGADWAGATRIVYSSATDELKEDVSIDRIRSVLESSKATSNPNGMRAPPSKINGGDVYLQRIDGRDITRITQTAGPDTAPTSDGGKRIVFVSKRDGDQRLYLFDGLGTRPISHGTDSAPAFSYDGKALAWERSTANGSQLFMSETLRNATPLTAPGSYRDQQPQWSSKGDGVIFASNRGGSKTTDLYWVDRKASCVKRLTQVQVDLQSPTMSPDGAKIAFTSKVNGQNQIFIMDDHSTNVACATTP